jgi:hypothetical protein
MSGFDGRRILFGLLSDRAEELDSLMLVTNGYNSRINIHPSEVEWLKNDSLPSCESDLIKSGRHRFQIAKSAVSMDVATCKSGRPRLSNACFCLSVCNVD